MHTYQRNSGYYDGQAYTQGRNKKECYPGRVPRPKRFHSSDIESEHSKYQLIGDHQDTIFNTETVGTTKA